MACNLSSFGLLSGGLRFCLTFIVLVALNIPHFGMANGAHESAMAMVHAGQSYETMDGAENLHAKMGGPLCATICLGSDGLEGPVFPQRVQSVRFVAWFAGIKSVWPSFEPERALRPPNLHRNA